MSESNKKTFEAKVDGKEIKLAVLRPNSKVQAAGQVVYNRSFRQAVKPDDGKPGAIVRAALESVLRDQKLWDDVKQKKFEELNKALLTSEKALAKGGIKKSVARDLAIQMRRDRWELRQLLSDRNSLDLHTAEAQAENARFNYFVSVCTVYPDTGKPYWETEEAYQDDAASEVAIKAASLLGNMLYGLEDDFEKKLPENKTLLALGQVNADLHLIDKQGRLINSEGKLVNSSGRLINDKGELIDYEGCRINEDGEYQVDFQPFLEDDDEVSTDNVSAAVATVAATI